MNEKKKRKNYGILMSKRNDLNDHSSHQFFFFYLPHFNHIFSRNTFNVILPLQTKQYCRDETHKFS
jgi:hypothetical protein